MQHALLTNDFPPKVGGIQSYLYELWRRLPPDSFGVLTSASHPDRKQFDASQPFLVERGPAVLLPTRKMRERAEAFISKTNSRFVVIDPAVPLGMIGPDLSVPYAVVLHGAEVTVPARLPLLKRRLSKVLANATHVISAGQYAADEAKRLMKSALPPVTVIPPGVDTNRFHPIEPAERKEVRKKWNLNDDDIVVIGYSRLVPRKGFDTLIEAAARLQNRKVVTLIVGSGRDRKRLERVSKKTGANARFLGRVSDSQLPELLAASDISAMLCRTRWAGLEQEGFGIVFVEAASCAVPQIAGESGGAAEAVLDGESGLVIREPKNVQSVTDALVKLVDDQSFRNRLAQASRQRAEAVFSYEKLSTQLAETLQQIAQRV
jgi:phosphatidylinositol alpha-1,6-mannosyltransferase